MRENKLVLGITGGIGSGKSTAASILRSMGAFIIDADQISRHILDKGSEGYFKVIEVFGPEFLDANRDLDRKAIADKVFSDNNALTQLNDITHGQIAKKVLQSLKSSEALDANFIVLDVPLPVKAGFLEHCHYVWVIEAPFEQRIDRLQKSRGYSYEECINRINSQPSIEMYREVADKVIINDGDQESLERKIREIIGDLVEKK